jgi:hypothetical protein
MPTSSGQFQLQDYISELQVRGFDGFSPADLTAYVNRGYFHVARRARWSWEKATDTFSIAPGSASVQVGPNGSELPNFRSLDRLVGTTSGLNRLMKPIDDETWARDWLWKDLTQGTFRGEPERYYLDGDLLYVTPPPLATRTFTAYYHRRVTPMTLPTDVPITPQHLDEALILGALIRCHRRANEPTLAALAEADLEEFFDDMRDDEEQAMGELLDRVRPDDTWL